MCGLAIYSERQVSWLPDRSQPLAFPTGQPSRIASISGRPARFPGLSMSGPSPVTVAGAAPDFHRLPFTVPSRQPYACGTTPSTTPTDVNWRAGEQGRLDLFRLMDTKNSASSSWLWSLWETRRVFQVAAGNAQRLPQTRQNPQSDESCCNFPFEESGFCLRRADSSDRRVSSLTVVENFNVVKQGVMCGLAR